MLLKTQPLWARNSNGCLRSRNLRWLDPRSTRQRDEVIGAQMARYSNCLGLGLGLGLELRLGLGLGLGVGLGLGFGLRFRV